MKHGRTVMSIIIVVAALVLFALAWSPWLNDKDVHDRVLRERALIDGTIGKDGNLICDYKVMWAPFGRWVASCEGGYYITFWDQIVF